VPIWRLTAFLRTASRRELAGVLAGLALLGAVGGVAAGAQSGPLPPARPLAQAIYTALHGSRPEGLSATVKVENRLFEGASLTGAEEGRGLRSLLTGNLEGRLWIAGERARLELDGRDGDSELLFEPGRITLYSVPENTLYLLTLPAGKHRAGQQRQKGGAPTLAEIERALAALGRRAVISAAQPTDSGGQPAYRVTLKPRETGSLLGGLEAAFDAENGVPLRLGVLSTSSPAPALALELQQVSFAPPPPAVFNLQLPAGVAVKRIALPRRGSRARGGDVGLRVVGHGLNAVYLLERPASPREPSLPYSTGHATVGSQRAEVIASELGGLVTMVRDGMRVAAFGLLPTQRLVGALGG